MARANEVQIVLRAVDEASAALRAARDGLSEIETQAKRNSAAMRSSAQRMEADLRRLGRTMQTVGRNMSLYVTAPIAAIGTISLKAAGDFEASMNRVGAISQATGQEIEALESLAKDLGATTQFSATQAADAMGFLAMAGFDANEVLGALPGTLQLAAAGQMDLAEAADIASNVLTGFRLEAAELARVNDVLASASINSNTNVAQLGEGMKYVAPIASGLGVSIEEATAAMGFMSDAGLQASLAGTGLRRILSTVAQDAGKLGITAFDAAGNLLPLADIIEQLEARSLTTAEALEYFGDRGGPALEALLSRGSSALREFTGELEDSGGTAERIANAQMEGLNGALKEFRSALEAVGLAIADSGLLEWATDLVKEVAALLRGLSETNPELLRVGTIAAGVAAAIGPLLVALGGMVRLAAEARTGLLLLRGAMLLVGGPAGAAVLLGTALAALAWKFRGRDDSLDNAVADVQKALAGNDNTSLLSALDRVAEFVDGEGKTALQALRDDLAETGDAGEDAAARIAGAFATIEIDAQIAALNARMAGLNGLASGSDISASPARDTDAIFREANLNREDFVIRDGSIYPANADVLGTSGGMTPEQHNAYLRIKAEWERDTAVITANARVMADATAEMAVLEEDLRVLYGEREALLRAAVGATGDAVDTLDGPPPDPAPAPTATGDDPAVAAAKSRAEAIAEATARNGQRVLDELLDLEAAQVAAVEAATAERVEAEEARAAAIEAVRERHGERVLDQLLDIEAAQADQVLAAEAAAATAAEEAAAEAEAARIAEAERTQAHYLTALLGIETAQNDHHLALAVAEAEAALARQAAMDAAAERNHDRVVAELLDIEAAQAAHHARVLAADAAAAARRQAAEDARAARVAAMRTTASPATLAAQAAYSDSRRIAADPALLARDDAERARAARQATQAAREAATMRYGTYGAEYTNRATNDPRTASVAIPIPGVTATVAPVKATPQEELDARAALVEDLTTFSADDGPLRGFGEALLGVTKDSIPGLSGALDGFVTGGPLGALIGGFMDLLQRSEGFTRLMDALGVLMEPLVALVGQAADALLPLIDAILPLVDILVGMLQPAFALIGWVARGLAAVLTGVVDVLVGVWNFLFGWLYRIERRTLPDPEGEPDPEPEPTPAARAASMNFGSVTGGVQLAVATPLVEAASTLMEAAEIIRAVFSDPAVRAGRGSTFGDSVDRFGQYVDRLVTEGITVSVAGAGGSTGGTSTAALRGL